MPTDSKYSPTKKVHQAQYLAELLCENSAAKSGISLPTKFWQIDEWRKFYVWQVTLSHKFLKEYDFDVLVTFISQKKIYSLAAGWILDALSKFHPAKLKVVDIDIVEKSCGRINKDMDFGFLD